MIPLSIASCGDLVSLSRLTVLAYFESGAHDVESLRCVVTLGVFGRLQQ
jgi:hypothetical protein